MWLHCLHWGKPLGALPGNAFHKQSKHLAVSRWSKADIKIHSCILHRTYDSPTRQYLHFEAASTRRAQNFFNSKPKWYNSSWKAKKHWESWIAAPHTRAEGNLDAPLLKEHEGFQGVSTYLPGTILMVFVGGKCLSKKIIFFFNIYILKPGEITERSDPDTAKIPSDCTIKHAFICE